MAAKGPFLVLYGDEDFLMDRTVNTKRQSWKKTRTVIMKDGGDLNDEELVSLCESNAMFGEPENKAIFLDNAQDLKLKGDLAKYIAQKDPKDLSCLILAVVRSGKLPQVWKDAVKKGEQGFYQKLKPWDTDKAISRIIDEAALLGVKLDQPLAELIHRYLGDNLRATVSELSKLSYLANNGTITKAQIVSVLTPDLQVAPYQIAEAALERNSRKALNLMTTLYTSMGDGANVPLAYALMDKVEKLTVVRHLLDQGETSQGISIRLGVHEYVCKKSWIPLAQKHTLKDLFRHMQDLCKLDVQVKGAARSKRTLVELAVLSITA